MRITGWGCCAGWRPSRRERGVDAAPPTLNLGVAGGAPESYIPDVNARINLHARLARLTSVEEIDGFEEEIEDRFGPPPEDVRTLLALRRLSAMAAAAGVTQVAAGPKAIAFTLRDPGAAAARVPEGCRLSEDRLICDADEAMSPLEQAERIMARLG